jgi:hypothetical protein
MYQSEEAEGDGGDVASMRAGRVRRRRGCGKVEIPQGLRDFQAEWETRVWFSTERLFHSRGPRRVRLESPSYDGRLLRSGS